MITIQAFLVLHNLRKLSKNTNTEMNMLGNSTEICLGYDYDKTYDYHKYAGEITALIDSLAEENYLTYTRDNKNSFALTAKGIRTFQIFTGATVKHFLCIIVIPIVVSIIASVITTYITLILFRVI